MLGWSREDVDLAFAPPITDQMNDDNLNASSGEITSLLVLVQGGDRKAEARVLTLLYDELHVVAERVVRRSGKGETVCATDLVNLSYERLFGKQLPGVRDRSHFLCLAARAMGWILQDRARRRCAEKRNSGQAPVEVDPLLAPFEDRSEELVAIRDSLERLREVDEEGARVVELHFYMGLTMAEVGEALGFSERTALRRWEAVRNYLWNALQ